MSLQQSKPKRLKAQPTPKQLLDAIPTNTATPAVTATPTVDPVFAARLDHFNDLLNSLHEENYIVYDEGEYAIIDDFNESWAQLGYYQWVPTGYSPSSFVVRTNASWESASTTADWWTSGCGFVFREGSDSHYLFYLALDGNAYLIRNTSSGLVLLGQGYYGNVGTPSGKAELMLVANGDQLTLFVNGQRVYSRKDSSLSGGKLNLTLLSGTNKDFGTNCEMKNIDLWIMD